MSHTTMTVRINDTLSEFVAQRVGEEGVYESVSEYVRDLIRRERESKDQAQFERLKTELKLAFSAPDSSYHPLSAADVIQRNQSVNSR